MSDFESDLRKQLAREADAVQRMPRDLSARIAEASGPRPALWLRLAPVAVAVLMVAGAGLLWRGLQPGIRHGGPAPTAAGSPEASPAPSPPASATASPATSPATNLGLFVCGAAGSGGKQVVQPSADGSGNPTAVRAAHQAGFDRITFEFAGATLPQYTITPQTGTRFNQDGSGMPVDVQGNSGTKVVFHGASERDLNGHATYTGSNDIVLPPATGSAGAVAEVRQVGDFERVLSWATGLSARPACTRVLQLSSPTRLVIDVQQQP